MFGAAVDGHTAPPGQHRRRIPPRGISTHQLKTMNDPIAPISEVTISCPNSSPPRLKPLMPTGERTHITRRDLIWLRRVRYECAALDDTPQTRLKHPVINASESALHQPTLAGRTSAALSSTLSSMRSRFARPAGAVCGSVSTPQRPRYPALRDVPRRIRWMMPAARVEQFHDRVSLVTETLFDECDQALRTEEVVEGGTKVIHIRDV